MTIRPNGKDGFCQWRVHILGCKHLVGVHISIIGCNICRGVLLDADGVGKRRRIEIMKEHGIARSFHLLTLVDVKNNGNRGFALLLAGLICCDLAIGTEYMTGFHGRIREVPVLITADKGTQQGH